MIQYSSALSAAPPMFRNASRLSFRMFTMLAVAVVMMVATQLAQAGQFFERGGVAIDGYDPVAYFTDNKPVKGKAEWQATYGDSVFHFSSAEHRDLFAADPARYAPQFNGFCAYGVSQGAKVKIEGDLWAVVDVKLYLNYDESVQETWNEDRPGYIKQAEQKWPGLK